MNTGKLTGKKIILLGAGIIGGKALDILGSDKVHCFADNNKAGQVYFDKRVISFGELAGIHHGYDVVISARREHSAALEVQCNNSGIRYSLFLEWITHEHCESDPAIRQFENIHKGKRCFLIGNGPSLRAEDLTKLHEHGEISFGCNAISKIFNQTPWRPNYLMASDFLFYRLENRMMADTEADYKFFPKMNQLSDGKDAAEIISVLNQGKGHVFYLNVIHCAERTGLLPFSPDISKAMYACGTVMYVMMQLAVYMGISQIYLLGVDGDNATLKNMDEYLIKKRHFYDEYLAEVKKQSLYRNSLIVPNDTETSKRYVARAYRRAENYTREHGVKIFNATRGGVTEEFERVDFDTLF